MSVAVRMRLLVAVTLVGMAGLWLTALYILNDNLLEDRKEQTRRLVQSALGILEHHHKLMLAGTLSDAEARTAAKNALRSVRYGQNDYYFIFDAEHRYVINPPKPELEGQDKAALQDANGKYLVRELVATARAGGGFVEYAFPRAGESEAKPKLSYSAWFEPWGWALGTGIYIDDIDSAYRRTATLLGAMAAAILIGVGFLGLRTTHSILRQLGGEPAVARAAMHEMAAGNLVVSVGAPPPDSLLGELNTTASSLRDLVRLIEAEAATLVSHAAEINAASEGVTKAAADEADSTSAIAAAIEQLTVSSSQILDIARETEGNSQEAMSLALEGGNRVGKATQAIRSVSQTVTEASERIEALETRAAEISTIANVIKEIAGQTNLLALNAAIEAARAGEQGRGFAVVADEVRKLAERTTDATSQIEAMLTAIQLDTNGAVQAMKEALPVVQQGVALASGAAESLHAIEGGARLALDRVHDVANATREQSAASTSIAQRVEQIARMVDETSVAVRNNGETAAGLEEIARRLQERVAHFKV